MLDLKKKKRKKEKKKLVSQCERFDHSLSWDGSLVAWQLACFLLGLVISPTAWTSRKHKESKNNWVHVSCADSRVHRVEVARQRLQLLCKNAVSIKQKCLCERQIILDVGSVTSGGPAATEEMGSVQLSFGVLRSARQPAPRSQRRQSQSNSWCLWQANQRLFLSPCWLALPAPGAPLRRKNHLRTRLVDRERYQPVFNSVSFPHLHSALFP